jgi:hypothetical protein
MNKIYQVTEAMFEGHDHEEGNIADALLKPFNRDERLVSVMTRAPKKQVELLDDIATQLGVSRASFLSMALDDAIEVYQSNLFEKGINDASKVSTMRGFNPEESV